MEQSSGILPHSNLVSEFQKLKCQVQRREPVNAAAVDIEEEADFVDEVILKVGKQTDSVRQVRCFAENFSPEYFVFSAERSKIPRANLRTCDSRGSSGLCSEIFHWSSY